MDGTLHTMRTVALRARSVFALPGCESTSTRDANARDAMAIDHDDARSMVEATTDAAAIDVAAIDAVATMDSAMVDAGVDALDVMADRGPRYTIPAATSIATSSRTGGRSSSALSDGWRRRRLSQRLSGRATWC